MKLQSPWPTHCSGGGGGAHAHELPVTTADLSTGHCCHCLQWWKGPLPLSFPFHGPPLTNEAGASSQLRSLCSSMECSGTLERNRLLTCIAPWAHHKDVMSTDRGRHSHILYDSISMTCWKRQEKRGREQIRGGRG